MKNYGITLANFGIAEDKTSMSETFEHFALDMFGRLSI